jgi:hypothetical protein
VEVAQVPERKLTAYLLSHSHPAGRSKAAFFLRFGFAADAWRVLADALVRHAARHEVAAVGDSPFGTRYVIDGPIESPNGRDPAVRVVWFIEAGETTPRLVTAYPRTPEGDGDEGA